MKNYREASERVIGAPIAEPKPVENLVETPENKEVPKAPVKEKAHAPVKVYGKVKNGKLNLRQDPSASAKILAILPDGEKLEIVEDRGEWMKVRTDDNLGFVMSQFVNIV